MATTKGTESRDRIVERAFRLASREGLEGLSLAALAEDLGVSKSGLFAHFKAKEELQLAVLEHASQRFENEVVKTALRAGHGLPRLQKLFDHWIGWLRDPASPGGCIFVAAAAELDDREGRVRDYFLKRQRQLDDLIVQLVRDAIEDRHLRQRINPEQVLFELRGIIFATSFALRMYRDRQAIERARRAFDKLLYVITA